MTRVFENGCRVDFYEIGRHSGPVRVTHTSTNTVVTYDSEESLFVKRVKAMDKLCEKLEAG